VDDDDDDDDDDANAVSVSYCGWMEKVSTAAC